MTLIDKTVSRILLPFLLLYSIYMIIHGHLTPGGGFQGGVLLASSLVLMCLVYGINKTGHIINEETSHRIESLAGVLLAFLIILEFFLRESLLPSEAPFQVWSGGEILFLNMTGGLIVMTAFIIIFHSMVKE